jgi:hypothetical protein
VHEYNRRHFERELKQGDAESGVEGIRAVYSLEEIQKMRERLDRLEEACEMRKHM